MFYNYNYNIYNILFVINRNPREEETIILNVKNINELKYLRITINQ